MNESELERRFHEARRDADEIALPSGEVRDLDHALRLQLAVADSFVCAGERIGGWKVGLTSGASRDRMGVDVRPFGYVLGSCIRTSDWTFSSTSLPYVIEGELCLVLGEDLGGEISPERAREAVTKVAAAFEIVQKRVPIADPYALVADGLGNHGVVIGDTIPVDEFTMRGTSLDLYRDGRHMGRATANQDLQIDDPFLSLARLSTMLHRYGRTLQSGQSVITGSFLHLEVGGSSVWEGNFSDVGSVRAHFK